MPEIWTFHLETSFLDARPFSDVKYDLEKRVHRLLTRDQQCPEVLLYRGVAESATTRGTSTIELQLEAAGATESLYILRLSYQGLDHPRNEQNWKENMRNTVAEWIRGLTVTSTCPDTSAERYRQILAEITARENEPARPVEQDSSSIRLIQEQILVGIRAGKSFFTASKEGGTHVQFLSNRFVFQDYGESDEREEFTSEADFLARLRKFYAGSMNWEWSPHTPSEKEAWIYIANKLS